MGLARFPAYWHWPIAELRSLPFVPFPSLPVDHHPRCPSRIHRASFDCRRRPTHQSATATATATACSCPTRPNQTSATNSQRRQVIVDIVAQHIRQRRLIRALEVLRRGIGPATGCALGSGGEGVGRAALAVRVLVVCRGGVGCEAGQAGAVLELCFGWRGRGARLGRWSASGERGKEDQSRRAGFTS